MPGVITIASFPMCIERYTIALRAKVTRTPEITISRCLIVSRLIRYGREDCSDSITIVFWTSTFTTAFRRKGLYVHHSFCGLTVYVNNINHQRLPLNTYQFHLSKTLLHLFAPYITPSECVRQIADLFRRKRVPPIPLLSAAPTGCSSCLFVRISAQPAESVTAAATNITKRGSPSRFTLPPFLTPNRQFPSEWFR